MAADDILDLVVIGGGINGAGIVRDAAGRGLRCALVEAGDLGVATSSASTKLIHGGLRYLEFYAFRLVAKALAEREVILSIAPHLSWPLAFILPHEPHLRPRWLLRAGLLLYDNLARRRQVPGSEAFDLRKDAAGPAFRRELSHAFRYWDGWVDDARLVVANVRDAAARGCAVHVRDAVVSARRHEERWELTLASGRQLAARALVNAAGPWAHEVGARVMGLNDAPALSLVQGAHIVTRRVNRSDNAWMLQQPDGRIVFVIPYEGDFSLIGTTETPVGDPAARAIQPAEEQYLLDAVNRSLAKPLGHGDIVHRFAGVRPLVLEAGKGARETTRDWHLVPHEGSAMTVVGGKITTYRLLAEAVLKTLYPKTKPWTATAPLPGGDVPVASGETAQAAFARWLADVVAAHPDYDPAIIRRLARLYGTETEGLLAGGLGEPMGGMFEAELAHMREREWARTADDMLWRRSKMGLHLDAAAKAKVAAWAGG
ncbi:glycerol-3-phosphate dehydrogenase [Sandaracinobacteroides saxicola]|uniref:Glycerol-3-phosphate dehydrogenase n=1 Tax=Sandaracinobacteroides saxicola TaxID=2759707 RepID=A0A7G5IFY2_9SPHN|nr:glycerol-3-phosphate dehydrogenase [Sandaracinobacteroides saxicola]QMW22274.1 glycerol-3-phosphate dehydrogenase [Sandaracinobacteroides saxicola]